MNSLGENFFYASCNSLVYLLSKLLARRLPHENWFLIVFKCKSECYKWSELEEYIEKMGSFVNFALFFRSLVMVLKMPKVLLFCIFDLTSRKINVNWGSSYRCIWKALFSFFTKCFIGFWATVLKILALQNLKHSWSLFRVSTFIDVLSSFQLQ